MKKLSHQDIGEITEALKCSLSVRLLGIEKIAFFNFLTLQST